jgi:hypothetical protein
MCMSRLGPRFGFTRLEMLAVTIAILVLCLTVWFTFVGPLHAHNRWHDRVRADILTLAHKRPPEVNRHDWESIVCWTVNLHANCSQYRTVDVAWRERFVAELEERLQGPIALRDIEWIWDEYASNTRSGPTYSDSFRPTLPENRYKAVKCGLEVE